MMTMIHVKECWIAAGGNPDFDIGKDQLIEVLQIMNECVDRFDEDLSKEIKEKNNLQSEIDSIMLEFCPERMTKEQLDTCKAHQKAYKGDIAC